MNIKLLFIFCVRDITTKNSLLINKPTVCLPPSSFQVSVILTLMVPYNEIDADAPLMEMFAVHGCMFAKYIVAVGSIAGLTVSLLGSLFPMPRVIYAMAGDGLLFKSVYTVI